MITNVERTEDAILNAASTMEPISSRFLNAAIALSLASIADTLERNSTIPKPV